MSIYLDYIFFENLIMNLIIIYQINIFTKNRIKNVNNVIAGVIASVYATALYITDDNLINSFIIKLFIISICVYIAFIPKTLVEYMKKITYYYLISFVYIGTIIAITLFLNITINNIITKIIIYLISGIITYLLNKKLWTMWKSNIKNNDLSYIIDIEGEKIKCFVDTGNVVKDYINNLDVIFVNIKYFNKIKEKISLEKKTYINYATIDNDKCLEGYILKNINVYKDKKYICTINKITVVFVDRTFNFQEEYSGILGYNTYVENLRKVKI